MKIRVVIPDGAKPRNSYDSPATTTDDYCGGGGGVFTDHVAFDCEGWRGVSLRARKRINLKWNWS